MGQAEAAFAVLKEGGWLDEVTQIRHFSQWYSRGAGASVLMECPETSHHSMRRKG